MGSFNGACSVSNISIGSGDPVVFIPLEVVKHRNKIGDGNHMLIYSHCFYAPATMPIFGTYDDYGGLENIEKDANLKIIEKYFDISFDSPTYYDKSNKGIRGTEDFKSPVTSGMFIHREIFNTMIRDIQVDEWGEYGGWAAPNRPEVISEYFEYHEKIRKARKRVAQHIECEEKSKEYRIPFIKFGAMDKIIFTGTKLDGLIKTKYSGLRGNIRERITQPPFLHQNAKPDLKSSIYTRDKGYFLKLENHMYNVHNVFQFRTWEYKTFNAIYQPIILDHDPTKDDDGIFTALIDFVMFEHVLYATNNFYFPAMNGYQCGHKHASEILYAKAKEVMSSQIAEAIAEEEKWEKYLREEEEIRREILFRKFD